MKSLLQLAGAIALLSVAVFFGVLSWEAHQVSHQVEKLREDVDAQLTAARAEAAKQIEEARKDVLVRSDQQLTAARNDLMSFVEHSAELVNNRAGEALATVHVGMALANTQANGLRADLKPAIDHVTNITAQADEASAILLRRDALPAQLLGVTAAAKVTLGETAQAMRTIRIAAPEIASSVQRATDESALTAQQTRLFMGNLTRMTKPLPTWARIGLAVAPPMIQTGFTVGSWLALRGKQQ